MDEQHHYGAEREFGRPGGAYDDELNRSRGLDNEGTGGGFSKMHQEFEQHNIRDE